MAAPKANFEDHFDYYEVTQQLKFNEDRLSQFVLKRIGKRYLGLEDVKDPKSKISSLPEGVLSTLINAKFGGTWRGVNIMKDCLTLNLIHNLFYYLMPKTVLDFGSWTGASAMYYADQLELIGVKDFKVFSYDVSHASLHPKAKADQRIKFTESSLGNYKELFTPEFLETLEHPIYVSEDAHFNTVELLTYLNKNVLKKGDFILIQDLHPETVDTYDHKTGKFQSCKETNNTKEHSLQEFLELNKEWKVDNYFASYFGPNSSPNGYGYLTRVV